MKNIALSFLLLFVASFVVAQQSLIREGNKHFREGNFDKAIELYDKVLQEFPKDLTAMYNRSNALAKKGDKTAAMEGYDKIIQEGKDAAIVEKAYYDKGVLHQQQQQLDESINSWMESLKLDPQDQQARENLQKALREKKQQQEQEQQKKEEEKKENKEDKEKEKPKPQDSKLNKKQVEQLLKALEQKEKEVQKKMQQKSGSSGRPEKDW